MILVWGLIRLWNIMHIDIWENGITGQNGTIVDFWNGSRTFSRLELWKTVFSKM